VLAVLDEVYSTPFPNDEEDVVFRLAGRLADDPQESGGELFASARPCGLGACRRK
jgi:hypothetical protein